jgi:threonine dehydrogenase-like Zn-dependent dehydrogenase
MESIKTFGADYVIDSEKEDLVEQVGEITDGEMADVVIETTGAANAVKPMLDLVKPSDTCVHMSVTRGIEIPLVTQIVFKNIKLLGGAAFLPGHIERAIKFVEKCKN